MNDVPEIWHVTDVTVIFHFGLFFALLLLSSQPLTARKINNFQKILKNAWKYHHFTQVDQKTCYIVPEI